MHVRSPPDFAQQPLKQTSVKECEHACLCVCACTLESVSRLQSCVFQPKAGEYEQAGKGLEVQEKKNVPCHFEYFGNFI